MTLAPERPGHPAPPWLAEVRAESAEAIAQRRWRAQRPVEAVRLGQVEALRITPAGGEPRGRVLHFHGGGFRMGIPEMDVPFAEALADRCGVELILPRYRLAPEHPFPAGLNDGRSALCALATDLPVMIMGASAGGGIAAGVAAMARQDGREVSGLVLLSGWIDLTVEARAYSVNAGKDPLFSRELAIAANALYLQGHDPRDPEASPLFADPRLFPPTLINAGSDEVLADDARGFHERLARAGVPAQLMLVEGMEHVAVARSPEASGSPETFSAIAHFIDSLLLS